VSDGFDLTDIINNPKAKHDQIAQAQKELCLVMANTFETEQGRKALNVLSYKFFSQECFQGEEPNPYAAAKRDGQRDVLKFIYDCIAKAKG
jgi:hypothetical protein